MNYHEFSWLLGPDMEPDNSNKRKMPTSSGLGEKAFLPAMHQPHGPGMGGPHIEFTGPTSEKGIVPHISSVGPTSGRGVDNVAKRTKTDYSYFKGYFSPERFGTYEEVMDALSKPISSYSLLYECHPVHKPLVHSKGKPKEKTKAVVIKPKPVYRFPKNVKDLTGTGMFDGVPVRYVHSSVVKLHGVIKGDVYLCGCDSCDYTKTYTADDFEHHANCKTSHANNHIRFVNGKTIHQVVKELQKTPYNMLPDVIPTVTGSPINQEAFRAWKESHEAAKDRTLLGYGM